MNGGNWNEFARERKEKRAKGKGHQIIEGQKRWGAVIWEEPADRITVTEAAAQNCLNQCAGSGRSSRDQCIDCGFYWVDHIVSTHNRYLGGGNGHV